MQTRLSSSITSPAAVRTVYLRSFIELSHGCSHTRI
jgi:hypothetical protein